MAEKGKGNHPEELDSQAIAVARRQGNRGVELRAATSLARVSESSERLEEARTALERAR